MPNFREYIRAQRKQQGLSQKELGKRCGLSDATIQRLEGGLIDSPDCRHLRKIADALHIRRFYLLKLAGYVTEEDIAPSHNIHGLSALSDDDLNELQLFVDFLIHRKRLQKGGTECTSD